MRTGKSWIAMGLVVVLVGMAGRPAYAESLSIVAPVEPLTPRYLPQTLALAPADVPRIHAAVRSAQVAIPGPTTRVTGSHWSLTERMWIGIALLAIVIDAVFLTNPRD
jgi:hypothetical protein